MESGQPHIIDLSKLPPLMAKALLADYKALEAIYMKPKQPRLEGEAWLKAFREWVGSHEPLPHIVDDSRDSLYD